MVTAETALLLVRRQQPKALILAVVCHSLALLVVANLSEHRRSCVASLSLRLLQQGVTSDGDAQLMEPTLALDAAINQRDTSQIAALLSDDVIIHHGELLLSRNGRTAPAHPDAWMHKIYPRAGSRV